MIALSTVDAVTNRPAPGIPAGVPYVYLNSLETLDSGDVVCDVAPNARQLAPLTGNDNGGRLSILPDQYGTWTFGTTASGAYQRFRRNGNLLTAFPDGDPRHTWVYLLLELPNGS